VHNFLDFIILLGKNIAGVFTIYLRKQKVRRAYRGKYYIHPFFILLFLASALFVAGCVFIYKNVPFKNKTAKITNELVVDTSFLESPTYEMNADESDNDRFLEPFPVVKGMETMKYMVLADKYHRILYLLKQGQKKWGVIKTYPIAVGENEGKKQREGDKKTPEGLYFMVDKKTKSELVSTYGAEVAANYGPHAYVLNYPNRHDLREKRGGSGIWVHGTFENTVPIISRGCISMHNAYINDINEIIEDGLLTPVVIIEEYYSDLKSLINLDEIWTERGLVAEEFGIDPNTGKKIGKTNVRELPSPSVEFQPITLTAQQPTVNPTRHSPPQALAQATTTEQTQPTTTQISQPQTTPAQPTTPAQIPTWTPPSPTTQAQATQTQTTQPTTQTQTTPPATTTPPTQISQATQAQTRTPIHNEQEIIQFVKNWAIGWSSKDIERYSAFYDAQEFPNWRQYRANKQGIFASYDTISVILNNINVISMTQNSAVVRFNQLYRTERTNFSSFKQLNLVLLNGNWKITRESVINEARGE